TIAALAAQTETVQQTITAWQGPVTGEVPLTPIQHWFFEQQLVDPHHFNQALLFRLSEKVDERVLAQVANELVRHHDALRLRFIAEGESWRQEYTAEAGPELFCSYDLREMDESERLAAMERESARLQSSLNLTQGPLVRVAMFQLGEKLGNRML